MDVLSNVLETVRLCGSVFFTAEFSAPWALESPSSELLADVVVPPGEHVALFHVLMQGRCVVECGGLAPVWMDAGDVVVFPRGAAHTMRSDGHATMTHLDHVLSRPTPDGVPRVSLGGGGRRAHLLCGYLNCSQRFEPLFEALPVMLVIRRRAHYSLVEAATTTCASSSRGGRASSQWLATTLTFAVTEALDGRPGNVAMLGRLTELMFVEIIRDYMEQLNSADYSWLGAVRDPHVGRALRILHDDPARPWTVGALAREVAVSRSALAKRFTHFVGRSPMKYLKEWRIHLAKQLLSERTEDNIQTVAERIGYDSEPAFSRAFKRATGIPPARWRRTSARAQPSPSPPHHLAPTATTSAAGS